jgi:hypothetical protein
MVPAGEIGEPTVRRQRSSLASEHSLISWAGLTTQGRRSRCLEQAEAGRMVGPVRLGVLRLLVMVAKPAILYFIKQSRFSHLQDGGVEWLAKGAVWW